MQVMNAYLTQSKINNVFSDNLASLGYNIVHLPQLKLLRNIEILSQIKNHFGNIIITSQNAISLDNAKHFYDSQVFCVGKETAEYLYHIGIKNIIQYSPDINILKDVILKYSHIHNITQFTYLRGRDISFPLKSFLSQHDIVLDEIITYQADPIYYDRNTLPQFSHQDIMTILSKRTAKIFYDNISRNNVTCEPLTCFSFSKEIKNILTPLKFRNIIVTEPNLHDMYIANRKYLKMEN